MSSKNNGFLKQIFSIGNDKKGFFKRKFIIIFGVKIYLKNYEKAERKARQAYLDYLESAILPHTNDFVPLTNKPYCPLAESQNERERERERE